MIARVEFANIRGTLIYFSAVLHLLPRYPLMSLVGCAASLVNTMYPFNSFVDWNNVSKVSSSQQHQSGHIGNQTHNLSIRRLIL